jgi:hypothetical protein
MRTIVTAVVVVAVAVGAYLLGASREKLVILDAPTAQTGVLWHCAGRLSGVVRTQAGRMTIVDRTRRIETVADPGGLVDVPVEPGPISDRVLVETAGRRVSVPVLDCIPPRTGKD